MTEQKGQTVELYYDLTQQRAILENQSYILVETPDGIGSMSLGVFLSEYKYLFKPLSKAILPYC